MNTPIQVSLTFAEDGRGAVQPRLTTVCSFPLNARRTGHCGPRPLWAIEYHAKQAGQVYFHSLSGAHLGREPGTIHLYPPECDYWEDTHAADLPVQETYWTFTGGELAGLERFVDNPEHFARFHDPENLIGQLLVDSARFCDTCGQDAFWMAQSLFTQALFLLSRSRLTNGFNYLISSLEPQRSFSFQVEQYLRKNLSEKIGLAEVAHYMKTSESLLSHRFKAETGISPMVKLVRVRIEYAKSLLLKGEKLRTIAALTGHSSEYHLSRNFKAVAGVTPREFRARSASHES